jgi:hypothetical protein
VGLVIIAVGSLLLFHLEEHMYDHVSDYSAVLRSYRSVLLVGAVLCLAGCVVDAMALTGKTAVWAGIGAFGIAFTVVALALAIPVFNKEGPSGAVLVVWVFLPFTGGAILVGVGLLRLLWRKVRATHREN